MLNSALDPDLRLSLSCTPRADESLPGFLVRLAKQAHLPSAAHLAKVVGLSTPGVAFADADLSSLAELAGADIEILKAISYRPTEQKAHHCYRDGVVHREQLDVLRRRACTACLAADAHHQARWDLTLVACCPAHGLRLVNSCWQCEAKLAWQSASVDQCGNCNADLTKGPRVAVCMAEAAGAADVFSLASGEACEWLPAVLQAESRSVLVHEIMELGFMDLGWQKQRRPETLAAAGLEQVAQITTAGIKILRDWPAGLITLVERQVANEAERHGHHGARKALGEMYTWIVNLPEGSMRRSVMLTTSEFLARDKLRGHRMRRSKLFLGLQSSGTNIKEASTALNMTSTRVKRLAAIGLLTISNVEGSGKPAMVDELQLAALISIKPNLIDLQEACKLMGLHNRDMLALIQANLIPFVHRGSQDGQNVWGFDNCKLQLLLQQLAGDLSSEKALGTVSCATARRTFARRGLDIVAFFRLILDGVLRPTALDEQEAGLKGFLFSKVVVRAACRARDADTGSLSFQAVAETLGVPWNDIKHLTTIGVLQTAEGEIRSTEVNRFRREIVSGADLAREAQTSSRCLARRLKASGIKPITGPGVDKGKRNFYQNSDELLAALCVLKQSRLDKRDSVVSGGSEFLSFNVGLQKPVLASTIKEAAAALHVSSTRVKRLASAGLLTLSHVEGSGKPAMVDENQLAALVAVRPHLIDFRNACRLMGVARKKMIPLVEANVIPFVHRASQDGLGIWGFDSSKLLELMRRLEGNAPLGWTAGVVGFNSALKSFRYHGVGLVAFFRLVLDGGLKPVAIAEDEVGLMRLLFSKAGVRSVCRTWNANTGFLSLLAVSEALGIKWEVVKQLTTAGVLPTINDEVPVAEMERFRREVVSGADLAREVGTSPRYLALRLTEADVLPITGPGVDGGRQNFYRRTEELLDALCKMGQGSKGKTPYVVDNGGQHSLGYRSEKTKAA